VGTGGVTSAVLAEGAALAEGAGGVAADALVVGAVDSGVSPPQATATPRTR